MLRHQSLTDQTFADRVRSLVRRADNGGNTGEFGPGATAASPTKKPASTKSGKQVELASNNSSFGTVDNHNKVGKILSEDGSAAQLSIPGLREGISTNQRFHPVYNFYDDGRESTNPVIAANNSWSWTVSNHTKAGNILWQDGSAQQKGIEQLRAGLQTNQDGKPIFNFDGITAGIRTEPQFRVAKKKNDSDGESNANKAVGFDSYLGNALMTNGTVTFSTGSIITNPQGTFPGTVAAKSQPTPEAISGIKPISGQPSETAQIVQDGKLMFQLGKLDDADLKLKEALKRDPNNQAALYYESVIQQNRNKQMADAKNVSSMKSMVTVEKDWRDSDARYSEFNVITQSTGIETYYLIPTNQAFMHLAPTNAFTDMKLVRAKMDELLKKMNAPSATPPTPELDTALPKPSVPPPTPQPEILTSSNAFSTFSLNVSDVSFKLAAASLEKGQMPEPASVRSEEFINAFDYRDPEAAPGTPVAFNSERARYPFAHNRELLRFSLKTAAAGRQQGRPLNIVVLLDNSGSMERADRVRIIQEALRVLAAQLQPQDTFSIVTFARTARLRVDGIPGNQAAAAAEEIAKLTPEGGTNLGDALDLAYETALHHYLAGGDNRVVMLTDGAANLGEVNPDSLKSKVVAHRQQGISLDCFGIGWEGYNDDLLEILTRDGDGRYGFINTPEEASTEFATQIAGALHVAAQDVKVQVEFNPARVTSYRQIGYAKHQLTKEQFRDNTVAAAQIAAQEAGNALYTVEINPQGEGSIGTVHVRYRIPGTSDYREQQWDVPYTGGAMALETSSPAMRLAATASAFSEWLATSPFADQVSTDQLLNYLNGIPQIYGADTRPQKLEWMIRQARSISGK